MFEVTNQPPPLENYNLFTTDTALREAVARDGADWAESELSEFGATLGRPETIQAGFDANKFSPSLKTFDRFGHRIDEVDFHSAWHQLLALGVRYGLHSSPWAKPGRGAHVARAAGTYLLTQIEAGVYCPIAMTYGSVPTLRHAPQTAAEWLPRVFGRDYDGGARPVKEKGAALLGMAMTENQGGSDLRTNVTRATRAASDGERAYRINGHKWFMSAPMCDAFMVLAQTEKGPTCFLVPRFKPDGERNGIHLLRLKDKLGNRSNASSEAEFVDAYAERIGEAGRGIPTIVEMASHTRLDCAVGTSGLMRQAVAQAIHHASYRIAFQKRLIDQALMTNVLADLALEAEAAAVLSFRLARAYDEQEDEVGAVYRRVVTPAAKFWICKRASYLAQEAMEVIGGSGYIEECVMPRIYREMPVNSIWEGSGNVMCLDVLRAFDRTPDAAAILLNELADAASSNAIFQQFVSDVRARFTDLKHAGESVARAFARDLVLALQAALLVEHAPAYVSDAFVASRLTGNATNVFGALPRGLELRKIVDRAAPIAA